MSTRKKISIKGVVAGDPSIWTANSGTACIKFQVRCKDGLYECIGFHERSNIPGIGDGKAIAVRGSYRDQDAFESKTITIDGASVDETTIFVDAIVREYGSLDKYKKAMEDLTARKESEGFVLARYTRQSHDGSWAVKKSWFNKECCSRHPKTGEMWLSVELCMNILGANEVTKRLKSDGVAMSVGANNAKRYRDCLDEMLLEVGDKLAEEAPF